MPAKRTKAGQIAAKKCGVKFGAKRKLDFQQIEFARLLVNYGMRTKEVALLFRISRTTLWRVLKRS